MKRELADAFALPAAQIELALASLEGSAVLRPSPRHRALLRRLVSRASAEARHALQETVIAVEVFGRPAASFDPRTDTPALTRSVSTDVPRLSPLRPRVRR